MFVSQYILSLTVGDEVPPIASGLRLLLLMITNIRKSLTSPSLSGREERRHSTTQHENTKAELYAKQCTRAVASGWWNTLRSVNTRTCQARVAPDAPERGRPKGDKLTASLGNRQWGAGSGAIIPYWVCRTSRRAHVEYNNNNNKRPLTVEYMNE